MAVEADEVAHRRMREGLLGGAEQAGAERQHRQGAEGLVRDHGAGAFRWAGRSGVVLAGQREEVVHYFFLARDWANIQAHRPGLA